MKKRILSTILTLSLLLTLVPIQAFTVEGDESTLNSITLPIVQEGEEVPAPQGFGDGGIMPFSLTPNNPKYIYGYEGVNELSFWNSRIYINDTSTEPTENGLLQILDSNGSVLANSDVINYYQQVWDSEKQEYTGQYYISGVTFNNTGSIPEGIYSLRLVAGNNETYSCDTSLCIVGEETLLLSSANIQKLYNGKNSFEVYLQMYGFEKESDLDSFSMKLLDSNNEIVAQSTGNYRDLNGYNDRWSFYGEMKVLPGKTIENYAEYSLQLSFVGTAVMVDGVGAVTASAYRPIESISSVDISDPSNGILSVTLGDCVVNTTYQVIVSDGVITSDEDWSRRTIYGAWEGVADMADFQIEIPLSINGMSVSMKSYPYTLYFTLWVPGSTYRTNDYSYINPYYNSGSVNQNIGFEPYYVKPTAKSIPFVIACNNGCSAYNGSGDVITLCDWNGNEVGRCNSVTCVDGDYYRQFELKGTIAISGSLSENRGYDVLLNGVEIDSIYVVSSLKNRNFSITGAYSQEIQGYYVWTNFGIMSVSADVINSTGSGQFEIRNADGNSVLTSTLVNGAESDYYDHQRFTFDFPSNEVMRHLSDGNKYGVYFKDSNGSEDKLRDVVFKGDEVPFDLTNSDHRYFQGGSYYTGTQELEVVLYNDSSSSFRNVPWEEVEIELKKVSIISESGDNVSVSAVTRTAGNRIVYLQLSKPLSVGEYSAYYNGEKIRTYTVKEKESETSQPPRIYDNTVGLDCAIHGSYLPTTSTYTARIFKGYTCVVEEFSLTLSGENTENTQYLRFAKSEIADLEAGEYSIRVYMDGKVLGEAELNVTAGNLIVIEAYDPKRGYRQELGMGNAIIESGYIAFQIDAGNYVYYRFSEHQSDIENEDYYRRIGNYYMDQLSEGTGEKTLYVQLKDSAGGESEVYEVKVWQTDGEKLDIYVDESIQGIYSEDTITLTIGADCSYANAYVEFIESNGSASVVPLAYKEHGQLGDKERYIYSKTFSIGNHSWSTAPNTSNAMVRFFLGTGSTYNPEYLSEIVERVLIFGDPTYIIMPQFSQHGELVTNKSSYQLYGYATPNSTVTATVNSTPYTAIANDQGYFTIDLTSLSTGEYKISLQDSNYVASQMQYTLTVDTTPPTMKDVGFTFNNDDVSAVLRWTCEDQDVERFEIYKNSTHLGSIYNKSDSGNYVYSVIAQADDGNRFTIKALDQAGNESTITVSTADTEPPTAPSSAPQLISKTTTTISLRWGAGSDNMGVAGYNIYNGEEKLAETNGEATTYTLTGLKQGQEYNFTVKTRDRAGLLSPDSSQLTVSTVSLSFEQANLEDKYVVDLYNETKRIPVTAQVSADEQEYEVTLVSAEIEFRTQGTETWISRTLQCSNHSVSGNWDISGSGADGFLPVGNYEVRFRAIDSNGAVVVSSPVKVVLLKVDDEAPTAPGIPTADSHNTTTITFHWAAATDNVAVDHYDIYRDNAKVGTTQSLSYTDTGLEMGHGYSYMIKAVDRRGNTSVASSAATLSTMELQFDSVITFASSYVMEEQNNKEIAVWAKFKPEEGYAPAVTMTVEYKLSTSSTWSSANLIVDQSDKNRFTGKLPLSGSETGYLPAGDYSIRFAVTDESATAYSDTQTVSLQRDTTPPAVSSLTPNSGTFGGKGIRLNVSATDNVGVDRIVLAYAPKGSTIYSEIATIDNESNGKLFSTSYTWDASDLSSGEYTIKATAYDIRNNAGEIEEAITIDNTPPDVPSDFTVTGTSRYIHVMWDVHYQAPLDFSFFKVYRAETQNGEYAVVSSPNTIGYYDDGQSISTNTVYYYYVTACDRYGNESVATEIKSATLVADTESPTIGEMLPTAGSELCKSALIRVTAADNYRLTKAVFEYRLSGSEKWQQIGVDEVDGITNNTSFSYAWDIAAFESGQYEIRVSVYDESVLHTTENEGKYQANAPAAITRIVSIRKYTAPVAPVVSAVPSYKSVKLNWTYSGDSALLSNYTILRSTEQNGSYTAMRTVSGSTTTYTDAIPVGTTYYYKVTANDKYGAAATSTAVSAISVGTDTENPVAVISPEALIATTTVPFQFSAVNSTDNDVIVGYRWNFGDGATSTEVTPSHQYSTAGTYHVSLTVTDEGGNSDTAQRDIEVVDVTAEDAEYTLVTFHIVDAGRAGSPAVSNATLYISSELNGSVDTTAIADNSGVATVLLMRGEHTVSVTSEGFMPSTKTLQVTKGTDGTMNATIGLSKTSLVSGNLTSKEMTYDEIVRVGIDVNNPDNEHVWKFETKLTFNVGAKTFELPVTTGYKNSAGTYISAGGGWFTLDGISGGGSGCGGWNIGFFPIPVEGFYLVIYGEAHWLKEMYNVELLVMNNSQVDTIQNCVAELDLPEGLSLAAMLGTQQTSEIQIGDIVPSAEKRARWFVRGDAEGEYYLSANVAGDLVSGNVSEPFAHTFTTNKPVKVYAGSALKLTITVDDMAERGEEYNVTFRLTNVSDKTLNNMSFGITGVEQGKILSFITNDGIKSVELPIESQTFNDSFMQSVQELAPGGYLELKMSTTIWFNSMAEIGEVAIESAINYATGTSVFGTFVDVAYFLNGVSVTTLEGSTTTIPHEIIINHVDRPNFLRTVYDAAKKLYKGESDPPTFADTLIEVFGSELPIHGKVMAKTIFGVQQGTTNYKIKVSLNDGKGTADSYYNDIISITSGNSLNYISDFGNNVTLDLSENGDFAIKGLKEGETALNFSLEGDGLKLDFTIPVIIDGEEVRTKVSIDQDITTGDFTIGGDYGREILRHIREKEGATFEENPLLWFASHLDLELRGTSEDGMLVKVNLSKDFLSDLANETVLSNVNIETELAKLGLDIETVNAILAADSKGDAAKILIKKLGAEVAEEKFGIDAPTYELLIDVGDDTIQEIHNFGEGKVEVEIPYKAPTGAREEDVQVHRVQDDGSFELVPSKYDSAKGLVDFSTDQFSFYRIYCLTGEVLTGTPEISGQMEIGKQLIATVDGAAGNQLTCTWYRGDDYENPIYVGQSYCLTHEDSNTTLTVRVSGAEGSAYDSLHYIEGSVTVPKLNIKGSVDVKLSADQNGDGVINVGDTLSAKVLPDVAVTYQWSNNGEAILGATSSTYVVAEGNQLITVTVTPSENYTGTLTSTAIEVGKSVLAGTVTINGTATVGSELTVEISAGDATSEDYTITWLRDNEPIPAATDPTYVVTKGDQGKTISVKIIAKGDRYTGEIVSSGIAISAAVPDAPPVNASAGNGQVTITWTTPTENGSPITGYTVQKNAETPIVVGADSTSYTFTGLTNGTTYTFKVVAINAVGASEVGTISATPKVPSYGGGGYTPPSSPSVSIDGKEGGKVETEDNGTVIITPDEGYRIAKVTINGREVEISADGKLSGLRPTDKVVVTFEKLPVITVERFVDVKPSAWYYDNVDYVIRHGLFYGTSDTTFSPNSTMTRGMLATVLYRMAGSPDVKNETLSTPFTDVNSDAYYRTAIYWASEKGIVAGYSNSIFDPDNLITREQLVAILYRYAGEPKTKGNLTRFSDSDKVSDYAVSALNWAVESGIISGKDNNTLDPKGSTTRAEVAAILMRFSESRK